MTNAPALFRSLLVYGLCLPLAVILGYLLANPETLQTFGVVTAILFVLAIPLLLRWHQVWLIASWNMTAVLFFVPGRPPVWTALAFLSFGIAVLQYALNRKMKFLNVSSVTWAIIMLTAAILMTAKLTGGFGVRALGGDTYGGKRYFMLLAGIVGYYGIVHRRIPLKRASLYVTLFLLGGATMAIGSLPGLISPALNWIFIVFPVLERSSLMDPNSVIGPMGEPVRMMGMPSLGASVVCVMLARYGVGGVLDMAKPWRFVIVCCAAVATMLGGFRSAFAALALLFAVLFYLERLHHTKLLLPVVLAAIVSGGLMTAFASRMPFSIQRSLSFVPFVHVDPVARMSAEASSEWRFQMWRELVPQIPQYLLVGKGYSFSGSEQGQIRFNSQESSEMVGDYHSGPLSVILTFGLFGSIAFVWLLAAGLRVVYDNYRFGDPDLHRLNTFLFAYFVVRIVIFIFVFGAFNSDLPMFLGLLGLSVGINGGVAKPVVVTQPQVVFNRFRLHPSVRPPLNA